MSLASADIPPQPGYIAASDSPLSVSSAWLERVQAAIASAAVVSELVVDVRSGEAWHVPAGNVCRITTLEGPQVFDLNLWNARDPRERFWASRTRQFYGTHVSTGARLWSNLPFLRPLTTIVGDSIAYGVDEDGGRCHDLLGTRCDPYVNELLSGSAYDFHCHSNLVRAVQPHGLTEFDVHDVINVFQVTGLMREDARYFMKTCPAKPGDHFDLFAEIDLLMAGSACPGGDLSIPMWGPDAGPQTNCHPIGVEVLKLPDGALDGWSSPPSAGYRGANDLRHGLRPPAAHPMLRPTKPH